MNNRSSVMVFSLVSFMATLACNAASPNQTVSPRPDARPSPEWNWGMFTNGICTEAGVIWENSEATQGKPLPIIDVKALNTNKYGFFEEYVRGGTLEFFKSDTSKGFSDIYKKIDSGTCRYYAPTNLSCPVMELRDATGKEVPSKLSKAALLASFPDSFSLSFAKNHKPDPRRADFPQILTYDICSLHWFRVPDYYDIPKPGEYTLTIWAKIYKRASTNDDICRRIDLPPVAVTFQWRGESTK
jgi:hypothetical protein